MNEDKRRVCYTFSILLSFYFRAVLSRKLHISQQTVLITGLVVNVLLYLFFILVVLVFHFTANGDDNSCGFVSVPTTYSTAQVTTSLLFFVPPALSLSLFLSLLLSLINTSLQKVISILYAAVIAAISLVIGILFFFYGYRVNLILVAGSEMHGKTEKNKVVSTTLASPPFSPLSLSPSLLSLSPLPSPPLPLSFPFFVLLSHHPNPTSQIFEFALIYSASFILHCVSFSFLLLFPF